MAETQDHKIPIKDQILRNETSTYPKYGQFPYFLSLHLTIVFFMTIVTYLKSKETVSIKNHLGFVYNKHNTLHGKYHILGIRELREHMNRTVHGIFSLEHDSMERIDFLTLNKLALKYEALSNRHSSPLEYMIKTADDSPLNSQEIFSNDVLKSIFRNVRRFYMELTYNLYLRYFGYVLCFEVFHTYNYDLTNRGLIQFYLDSEINYCRDVNSTVIDPSERVLEQDFHTEGNGGASDSGDDYWKDISNGETHEEIRYFTILDNNVIDYSQFLVFDLARGMDIFNMVVFILSIIEMIVAANRLTASFKVIFKFKRYMMSIDSELSEKRSWMSMEHRLKFFNLWNFLFLAANTLGVICIFN